MKKCNDFRVKGKAFEYVADLIDRIEQDMNYYLDDQGNPQEMWETECKAYRNVIDFLKSYK